MVLLSASRIARNVFAPPEFVALAGVPAEELIQCFFAAVKPFPIMVLVDGLFAPSRHTSKCCYTKR
jgi:hypothetical protein